MAVTEIRQRASGRTTNPEVVLTTELDSLGWTSGSIQTGSTSNDGTTELDMLADVEIVLGSITPSTSSAYVELWVCPSIDSTNYANTGILVGTPQISQSTSAKREVVYDVPVPFKDHKWKLVNRTGVTLASSANTVKVFYKSVGSGS